MKWNDDKNKDMTFSFDIVPNENAKAFFDKMMKECDECEKAMSARITELFNQYITIESSEAIPKEEEEILTQLFSIGYQLGWNDHHDLTMK